MVISNNNSTSNNSNSSNNESAIDNTSSISSIEIEYKEFIDIIVLLIQSIKSTTVIRHIINYNIDLLFIYCQKDLLYILLLQQLLLIPISMKDSIDIILTYFTLKLPEIADNNNTNKMDKLLKYSQSTIILKIFKYVVTALPQNPEYDKIFLTYLNIIIINCIKLSYENNIVINYLYVIRIIFRHITTNKNEKLFYEISTILPFIINNLYMMLTYSDDIDIQIIVCELLLTLPAKLEHLVKYMPILIDVFVHSISKIVPNHSLLTSLALRSFEYWMESLTIKYFYQTILQNYKDGNMNDIFVSICKHLRPAPYVNGTLALRILGKFGGYNKQFLSEFYNSSLDNTSFNEESVPMMTDCASSTLMSEHDKISASNSISIEIEDGVIIGLDSHIYIACNILTNLSMLNMTSSTSTPRNPATDILRHNSIDNTSENRKFSSFSSIEVDITPSEAPTNSTFYADIDLLYCSETGVLKQNSNISYIAELQEMKPEKIGSLLFAYKNLYIDDNALDHSVSKRHGLYKYCNHTHSTTNDDLLGNKIVMQFNNENNNIIRTTYNEQLVHSFQLIEFCLLHIFKYCNVCLSNGDRSDQYHVSSTTNNNNDSLNAIYHLHSNVTDNNSMDLDNAYKTNYDEKKPSISSNENSESNNIYSMLKNCITSLIVSSSIPSCVDNAARILLTNICYHFAVLNEEIYSSTINNSNNNDVEIIRKCRHSVKSNYYYHCQ
jgi:hypothetical protein